MSTSQGQSPVSWTTRKLLQWTTSHFEKKGVDSPRLATEMLLAHVLGMDRIKLYLDPDRPASELERATFRDLVERASRQEPVDYLVGKTPFFSMMFKVTPDVLVPRPSTETLVEHVCQHARRTPGFREPRIADIGTGSGIIAITLARHIPGSHVVATDISPAALDIARENAERHKVIDRIDFREGDLFEPLDNERFEYVVSNPPYISDGEWEDVEPNVKDYEPVGALRGGQDGLDVIRRFFAGVPRHLRSPGHVALEFAASQGNAVLQLAKDAGLTNGRVLKDDEGHDRVLVGDAAVGVTNH